MSGLDKAREKLEKVGFTGQTLDQARPRKVYGRLRKNSGFRLIIGHDYVCKNSEEPAG